MQIRLPDNSHSSTILLADPISEISMPQIEYKKYILQTGKCEGCGLQLVLSFYWSESELSRIWVWFRTVASGAVSMRCVWVTERKSMEGTVSN